MHYNFCRIHKTLRITPVLAYGVTDHVWSVADIVSIIEAAERAPAKRGLYKKRAASFKVERAYDQVHGPQTRERQVLRLGYRDG